TPESDLGAPASRRRGSNSKQTELAGGTPARPRSSNLQLAICNSQFSISSAHDSAEIFLHHDTSNLLAVSPHAELAQFFPYRFYLEVNNRAAFAKRDPSLPCVASLPIHYELPSDRWKYDIVQSIRTLTLLRQQHPEKRLGGHYYFRPAAEMHKRFAAHPELL